MSRQVWFLALAMVGVQRGLCLKCYSCLSSEPRDSCERLDKSKIPLKSCDIRELEQTEHYAKQINPDMGRLYEVHAAQEPMLPLNCLKQVVQLGDNKHYTLRGCQLSTVDNLDICVKVKKDNADLLRTSYCSLCNSDACNTAFLTKASIFTTAFMTLVTCIMFS